VQYGTWIYDGVDHPLEHVDASSNRQYYELDLAGNVRRLRAPGGADLGGYRYTAFGGSVSDPTTPAAPTGVNALPVRWKGRWLMYSTGAGASLVELYDMRARWWWPQGGVFVSVDGFNFHDQTSTLWAWPSQNPYRFADTSGHFGLVGFIGGAIAGGVGGYISGGNWQSVLAGAAVGGVVGIIAPQLSEALGASAGAAIGGATAGFITGAGSSALGQVAGNIVTGKPAWNVSFSAIVGAGVGSAIPGGLLADIPEGGLCQTAARSVGEGLAGGLGEGAGNSFQPPMTFSPNAPASPTPDTSSQK